MTRDSPGGNTKCNGQKSYCNVYNSNPAIIIITTLYSGLVDKQPKGQYNLDPQAVWISEGPLYHPEGEALPECNSSHAPDTLNLNLHIHFYDKHL